MGEKQKAGGVKVLSSLRLETGGRHRKLLKAPFLGQTVEAGYNVCFSPKSDIRPHGWLSGFDSTDLENALGILREKQGLCTIIRSEIVDAGNALARRPKRMVRAE